MTEPNQPASAEASREPSSHAADAALAPTTSLDAARSVDAPPASAEAPEPVPTAPLEPPPPPQAVPRSSTGGVPRALVAILAPVLAVVMFAGGLAVGRTAGPGVVNPGGPGGSGALASPGASGKPTPDQELALIEQAWGDIQQNYVDATNLDNQALAYAAIDGITNAVGDSGHTSFMTAAEAKAMDQSLSGTFVGIGVQISPDDGKGGVVVGSVFANTPAQQAGLKRGDRVVAVNGKATTGQTQDQVISSIRGPEGQPVTLTIQRTGVASFDVTIVRRKFDLPLSSWIMIPGTTIADIRLEQFATGAGKAVQDAIKAAKAAGATSIIFDLRGNGGGYVNEAVTVASQFVGSGTVYQSVDASGVVKDVPVESGGLATDIPLIVLANGDTASAAEIVTGAIQDAGRGKVVGVKTFGTGTVLGRFELADGSVLRIGIERWLTRAGRPIWHEGLEPDFSVALATTAAPLLPDDMHAMTATQVQASIDLQLVKAITLLKG
jgi:carboxyl-terminal processing protease